MKYGFQLKKQNSVDLQSLILKSFTFHTKGQMSEMRDFPKSVFFHEAQIQGLGSHLNNLNPFEVQREQQRANKVPEVNNIVSEGALNKKETDPVLPVEEIDAASAPRAAPKLSGDSSVDDGARTLNFCFSKK